MAAFASSRWMLHIGGGREEIPVNRFEYPEKRYVRDTSASRRGPDQLVGVVFAITTALFCIIPLITWLPTK